jgi:hypothetical protein
MFNQEFAERLLWWATRALFVFLALGISGAVIAYGLGDRTTLLLEVLGHWLIAVGALGVKTTYIGRLAALDLLAPDPDGWQRELRPPARLPSLRLESVRSPEAEGGRKRA